MTAATQEKSHTDPKRPNWTCTQKDCDGHHHYYQFKRVDPALSA